MLDHRIKLNDQRAKDLRFLKKAGWSPAAITTYFGISERTYRSVVHGDIWTGLDDYPEDYLSRVRKGRKTSYSLDDVLKLRELAILGKLTEQSISDYAISFGVTPATVKGIVWGYQQEWLPGAIRNSANRRELEPMFRYQAKTPDVSSASSSLDHSTSRNSFGDELPADATRKLTREELMTLMPGFIEKNMSNAEIVTATHVDYPTVKKMTTVCRKAKAKDLAWFDKMRQGKSYSPWMLDEALSLFESRNESAPLSDLPEHVEDEANANTTKIIAKALAALITSQERAIAAMRVLVDALLE